MGNTGVGIAESKTGKWKGWGEKRYMARKREKKTREAAVPEALGRE